jgi:hypothetical protein
VIVEDLLDQAQSHLHDDGVIWTRTELLEWLNDGYRKMLSESQAVIRPFQYDLPPRSTFAGTYEWEDVSDGTFQRFTRPLRQYATTFEWEVEHLEGATAPENSYPAVTQLWETYLTDDTNRHFRFIVGKAHERPLLVYWDDKQLTGTSDREMDLRDTRWWRENGQPMAWLKGNGRDQSFEVFEATTDYTQAYHLKDSEAGIPREFSGTRTYTDAESMDTWDYAYTGGGDFHVPGLGRRITKEDTTDSYFYLFAWELSLDTSTGTNVYTHDWEVSFASVTQLFLPVGAARYITSPDRQYLPAPYDGGEYIPVGAPRDYKSSEDSITLWEIIVPTRNLTESDVPVLVPTPLHKYLRFYVIGKAFARRGEGQRLDVAQHYMSLFVLGVGVLTNMGNLTFADRVYQREEVVPMGKGRPPHPRLPSTYPAFRT